VPDRGADDRKEDVRRATDIVALVERYLPLRRSGRSLSALCPFHSERTASFHVWPESQRWKCFSCGRSGDAFSFVMEKEGVEFPEALRMLARDAGIELVRPDPAAAAASRAKDAAYAACDWACRWFQGNLKGSPAADYLRGRGLDGAVAKEWRLGYAPDRWDGLLAAAREAGIGVPVLEAAGLVLPRKAGDGFYDRFRNRAMFPIADPQGRVVGFGARALGDEEPKYLNSPDSALFRKGALLFGLDRARDEAMRTRSLAVMEGYMDVVMAHQHGFRTAVAGLGTAFTPEQASLLRRFADRVVLVYDSDAAGRRAADRALEALLAAELDARVAVLPEAKDPCELLVLRGPDPLRAAIDGARDLFEHLLAEASARGDLATVAGRAAAADAMLRTALAVPNGLKRGLMIDRIGGTFGFPADEVRRRARSLAPAALAAPAVPAKSVSPRTAAAPAVPARVQARERALLEAALACPGLAARLAAEAPAGSFATPSWAAVAEALAATARADGTADPAACAAALGDPDLADEVASLAHAGLGKSPEALLQQFEEGLGARSVERSLEEARSRHSRALAAGDGAEESRWLAEVVRLQRVRESSPRTTKR